MSTDKRVKTATESGALDVAADLNSVGQSQSDRAAGKSS